MSGTSMDGLDISYLKTDGFSVIKPIFNKTYNYSNLIKYFLRHSIESCEKKIAKNKNYFKKKGLFFEKIFSFFCSKKLNQFLKKFSLNDQNVDLIGFHGQTLYHNAKNKLSFQLGDAQYISNKLNIPVISKFRQADLDNDGQGAPLVPLYHQKLFSKKNKKIAVINIGGISNITFLINNSKVFSSDIGPGNKLLDEYCKNILGEKYDFNGKYSAIGKENDLVIREWKMKKIFSRGFPRSFNNNDFEIKDFCNKNFKNPYDYLKTLVCLTASLISDAIYLYDNSPNYIIICGGGALNKTLVKKIKDYVKKPVFLSDKFGFHHEFIESQAFGYFGVRRLLELPVTFPSTTGTKYPTICGEITHPRSLF